ncbi:MAG: hypothetical protein M0Q91_12680 [Methanoregula sp.]|jgi:hypothetical protein|nr:hypothetical protein [Methanoregula sp.]
MSECVFIPWPLLGFLFVVMSALGAYLIKWAYELSKRTRRVDVKVTIGVGIGVPLIIIGALGIAWILIKYAVPLLPYIKVV